MKVDNIVNSRLYLMLKKSNCLWDVIGKTCTTRVNDEMPPRYKQEHGFVYLIKLFPADRMKIGFASKSVDERLKSAQTWIPEAELIKSWSSMRTWEPIARNWARANDDNIRILGSSEVLTGVTQIQPFVERLDEFFERMDAILDETQETTVDVVSNIETRRLGDNR